MRCTYKDDFKVDYSGSLHISKGDGVDLVVKEGLIPTDIRSNSTFAAAFSAPTS